MLEEPVDLVPEEDMVEEPLGLLPPAAPPDVLLPEEELPLGEEAPPDMVLLVPVAGTVLLEPEPTTGATGEGAAAPLPPAGTVAGVVTGRG